MQKFEPDQLVLVRYFVGAPWRLRRYSMPCKKGRAHETQDGMVFVDACIIPYSGNEHLLGTTDSPTPKWEPKPGELVAVSDNQRKEWYPAIFYNVQKREDGLWYRVKGVSSNCIGFKNCEPIRKHFTIPEE